MSYGTFCPECGEATISRSRGVPSFDFCPNKHRYPAVFTASVASTLPKQTRYAVTVEGKWLGKNIGAHWKTGLPMYELVDAKHARLYVQKAGATKAANVMGGTVVPVSVGG